MRLFLTNAKVISIFILGIFFLGCGDDDENKLPEVVSGFTQTIDEDTGTTTFINVSTNADKYLWDFGDEETSTEINPVKSYAASGDYTVTLTATNLAGASDVYEAILTIVVKDQIALPVTFDDPLVIYTATVFEGASFDIVDNPDPSGSNSDASQVGALTNIGATFEGLYFDLGADVDLEFNKSITMNFWSDAAVDVLIKLEEGTGADTEAMASHTGTGWELVTFDFESAESFSRLTLFVDGAGTTAGTFYLDDIIQIETIDTTPPVITLVGDPVISIVLGSTYTDAGATAMDNFDEDISDQIVVSGDAVNTSVEGQYIINYDVSDAAGNAAITVTRTVNVIAADTVKPVIVLTEPNPFNLTVGQDYVEPGYTATDDIDGVITSQVVVDKSALDNTTVGEYDIKYNVSDAAGNAADEVTRTVIVTATASCTDTILEFPIDFDCESLTYDFVVFNGAGYQVIDNPKLEGINSVASKVGEIVNTGSMTFEGGTFTLGNQLDLATDKAVTMKLYSTIAVPVLLKLEGGTGADTELTASHAGSGWEQLTWEFTSSDAFPKVTLFVDGPGTTTGTFYIDDIEQIAGSGGGGGTAATFPLDFEDGVNFFNPFEGATATVIDNPQTTGNSSSKVLEMVKPVDVRFFAGINSDQTLNGPTIDLSNGMIFKVKIWSPKANINVRMRLELEPGDIDPPAYEVFQTLTPANEWVTLTFDFTSQAMSSFSYTRLVLNTDWDTDPAGGEVYYIDDITQE